MNGPIVHFEIPTDDLERAQGFYAKAFGWKINSMPGMQYTLVYTGPTDANGAPTQPGHINGGMLKRQAPVQSVVITVGVPNIEAALKDVERLGGKVVRGKEQVAAMGFAAYVKDTEGNVIGLWQDASK